MHVYACLRASERAFACVRVRPYPSVFRHVYVCVYLRCMHACACLRASEHARARPRACTRAFVRGRASERAVCVCGPFSHSPLCGPETCQNYTRLNAHVPT